VTCRLGRDVALVAALLAPLLLAPLWWPPIGEHGEAREGLVVQHIVARGEWILPRRNGELPSKPPLFHWLAAPLGHAFGVSDATLRLPSAVAAAVLAATTFALGAGIGGPAVGWLALGALLTMLGFWRSASEARVDMVFAACCTLSLAGFWVWYGGGRRAGAARALCYLGAACAVLAKGPVGLVLPGLVIGVFLLWQRDLRALPRLWSWPLAAVVALLDGGWYALAIRAGGHDFVAVQLLYENVDRFLGRHRFGTAAAEPGFRHFRLRMPIEFARHFFPANLALLWAARCGLRGERTDTAARFLHAWWITVLAFFTLAVGKRSVYLLPLAPAVALLAGRALAAIDLRSPRRRLAIATAIVAADLVALTAVQATRAYHARRHSLYDFARDVGRIVPANAALYAAPDLEKPALLVLAYRLDRAIGRAPAECTPDAFVLARPGHTRHELVASATHGHTPVALFRLRCGDGELGWRGRSRS
jgi:4-amino-4-deoxy-L-arabinose transferase-like glycosyltransferase